ncbi:MAG: YwiC-like family protein [Polyangiaceae bacterium]
MTSVALPNAKRALVPKEHGAYAQLAFPMLTVLLTGKLTPATVALSVAPVAVFLAHEPMLLVLGQRGTRALREDGERAKAWLGATSVVALATGSLGLLALGSTHVWSALPALAAAVTLAPFIATHREKTVLGETLAAIAMAFAAMPAAMAAGHSSTTAIAMCGSWALGAIAATLGVRAVIAAKREQWGLWRRSIGPAGVTAATIAAWRLGVLPGWAMASALPPMALAVAVAALAPTPKHLKKVGWTLAASSLASLALLVVLLPR